VCALAADGRVFCWGNKSHYILGHGGVVATDSGPVAVRTDVRFSAFVHSGHAQSCGINRVNDVVHCWGHNDGYQLARGFLSAHDSLAQPVAGSLRARSVYSANFGTCILDFANAAHCAGTANSNRAVLGIDSSSAAAPTLLPVSGAKRFRSFAMGDSYECGIDEAFDAYCWGSNGAGQLGLGNREFALGPHLVTGGLKFATISSIYRDFTCGITTGGDLYCWGSFRPRTISTRIGDRALAPYQLAKGMKFRALIVGADGVCATSTDGRTHCW
jgi:alpha-tubulin suppressor-like RCC1 family protein